jgi:hypothetical protein
MSIPIPSLESILGKELSVDEEAMAEVETWPSSRTNLLEEVRKYLERVMGEDRELPSLFLAFANIRTVGEKSAYGVVRMACLRAFAGFGCQTFSLPLTEERTTAPMPVYVVIKSIQTLVSNSLPVPYAGLDATTRKWVGHRNHLREILMGRFLNHLVQARVSPHFPLIYEPFRVSSDTANEYFAMELCHYTINQFMTHVKAVEVPEAQKVTVLRVCLIQLCQALAAAKHHYNFKHNDFHGGNAMMTYITRGTFTYKVDGRYFAVPNFGMCWKLIDFGYAASDLFGPQDVAEALVHSTVVDLTSLSQIFFSDIMRLLLSSTLRWSSGSSEILSFIVSILDKIDAITATFAAENGIPLRGLPVATEPETPQELRRRSVDFAAGLQSKEGNMLDLLFAFLAEGYEVDGSGVDATSESFYDMNRAPVSEDADFSVYEQSQFYLDEAGNLNRKGGSMPVASDFQRGPVTYDPILASAEAAYQPLE